jgi:hypothetical protein
MENIRHICIFTNLEAGKKKLPKEYFEQIITKYCSNSGVKITHLILQEITEEEKLKAIKDNVDLLVINGGDGTIQRTITLMCKNLTDKEMPLVAVLATGSTNLIAFDVGGVKGKKDAFKRFIKKICSSNSTINTEERTAIHIKSGNGLIDDYGFFIGFAQLYKSSDLFNNKLRKSRFLSPIAMFLTMIYNLYTIFIKTRFVRDNKKAVLSTKDRKKYSFEPLIFYITSLKKIFSYDHSLFLNKNFEPGIYSLIIKEGARYLLYNLICFMLNKKSRHFKETDGYYFLDSGDFELTGVDGVAIDGELYRLDTQKDTLFFNGGKTIKFVVLT